MTCLLAVTTLLPIDSAAAIRVRAGSSPPISSTMTSISLVGDEVGRRVGEQLGRHAGRRAPVPDRGRRRAASSSVAPSDARRSSGRIEQRADDLAADGPRAEDADAQAGAAHDLGRCGSRHPPNGSGRRPNGSPAAPSSGRRLHSRTMTTDVAPAPAPLAAPSAKPRIFSGIQPSGVVHLGNDLGAIRNYVRLQSEYEAIYCIVDYHALTSTHDGGVLRARTREMAASLLALGLDPERCTLFVQSHRPEHTELAWLLATVTPVSWLERTPTYKEKKRHPARRRQPRPADLPGPAGRRHRHLQGVARAGRQGPGGAPRAVARDRPRLQHAATATRSPSRRRSSPRRRPSSAPTASAR